MRTSMATSTTADTWYIRREHAPWCRLRVRAAFLIWQVKVIKRVESRHLSDGLRHVSKEFMLRSSEGKLSTHIWAVYHDCARRWLI